MNRYFVCRNGENISWTYVCDGYQQCVDGSDERNCYCQGDVYACLQGNNVSCKIACATYGRVTCLTYQNIRACEQYTRRYSSTIHFDIDSTQQSVVLTEEPDAFHYSIYVAIGLFVLLVAILSILIYLIRQNHSHLLSSCIHKSFKSSFNRKSTTRLPSTPPPPPQQQERSSSLSLSRSRCIPAAEMNDLSPSYPYFKHHSVSTNDCYDPPFYPGPPLFTPAHYSDSMYYETIDTPSIANSMSMLHLVSLPELPEDFINSRTHCV